MDAVETIDLDRAVEAAEVEGHVPDVAYAETVSGLAKYVRAKLMPATLAARIVDDAAAITGGRNIGAVYFASEGEDENAVVDADARVTGVDAAAELIRPSSLSRQEAGRAAEGAQWDDREEVLEILSRLRAAEARSGRIRVRTAARST